jgi:Gram-negative bacterial TonB protein C-terminal
MNGLRFSMIAAASIVLAAAALAAAPSSPLPTGVILVKGAWSSAAGSFSALPEEGVVSPNKYDNAYFGVSYTFGAGWSQHYEGPPPSDGGYYVLAQMEPQDPALNARLGHFLIAAQDLFFSTASAHSAMEFVDYYRARLGEDYRVERAGKTKLAGHEFARLDYVSPASGLHWRVLATEIRCHILEFVFTGSDARSLDRQVASLGTLNQQSAGVPVCIKDFANDDTVLEREEPVFSEPRFNRVAVRVIIDREGRVKHIHFLSAFPEQARAINDALSRWRFKPYSLNGQPVEVETGVVFGRASRSGISALH